MKISPCLNLYNFRSNNRLVATERKTKQTVAMNMGICDLPLNYDLHYSNYTVFFRNDLNGMLKDWCEFDNWNDFIQVLSRKFKNVQKVHAYCLACSDGSEAYSLAMDLMDKMGADSEKFFPVNACDIDEHVIDVAKSGRIPCCERDIYKFSSNLDNFQNFAQVERDNDSLYFVPNENTASKIQFQRKNALDVIDKIESSDSLILARNFIPYLKDSEIELFAQKLADKLDNTSLLVTGVFDMRSSVWREALDKNFVEIYPLVYLKRVLI